jgi:hypothetical protein
MFVEQTVAWKHRAGASGGTANRPGRSVPQIRTLPRFLILPVPITFGSSGLSPFSAAGARTAGKGNYKE